MHSKIRIHHRCYVILVFAILLSLPAYAQKIPAATLHQKLSPALNSSSKTVPPHTVRVLVKDKTSFLKWMADQKVQATIEPVAGKENILLVSALKKGSLQMLLQNPWTEFIDRPNRIAREELELKDANFSVNTIYALHGKYPELNGNGFAASVKEGAFDPHDIDLKGRVLEPEKLTGNQTMHATTMATLIGGGGNSGPNSKGVAYRVRLASSSFAELMPDNSVALLAKGISVQNHSYGVGVENYYGIESAAYDRQVFENPQLLHVFSSGNSGDKALTTGTYANLPGMANLTGQFKTSKNTLSVGALEPSGKVGRLSSRGPAYDGRVKPELVAHGMGGTSEAASVVSGIALLVQQAHTQSHGGALPPAALVKAALINSADDIGRAAVDFESGYGNADALGAVRSIKLNNFITASITDKQEKKFTITVPENATLLKVTLVWHEKEASPSSHSALINDLDLRLQHIPSGNSWQPWVLNSYPHPDSLRLPAKRGIDRVNNIEQVTISTPQAGMYELSVTGFHIPEGEQEFSIVYEFGSELEWLYPSSNSALLATRPYTISWQANQKTGTAKLEYKYNSDSNWRVLEEALSLSENNYNWTTPDTAAIMQLRLVTEAGILASDEFVVSKLLRLKVGFDCDDQVMVHWTGMPAVQHYQLYQMGDMYLQPLVTTTDTLAILDKNSIGDLSSLIAVAPVIQNKTGYRSVTNATNQVGIGCYVKNFLPKQLVQAQATLQLELSTLYNLATVTLESKVNNEFREVASLSPTILNYELVDPKPHNGKNYYRVKLTTKTGRQYYSQVEEVIYASPEYIQVYPNPIVAGDPLNIVVSSESARLQLFDRVGKLMFETTENSVIKNIPTDNLPKGLYILRILSEDGTFLSARVIVL